MDSKLFLQSYSIIPLIAKIWLLRIINPNKVIVSNIIPKACKEDENGDGVDKGEA